MLRDSIARLDAANVVHTAELQDLRRERDEILRQSEARVAATLAEHIRLSDVRFENLETDTRASDRFLAGWWSVTRVIIVGFGLLVSGITVASYLEKKIPDPETVTVRRETADIITFPTTTLATATVTVEPFGGR